MQQPNGGPVNPNVTMASTMGARRMPVAPGMPTMIPTGVPTVPTVPTQEAEAFTAAADATVQMPVAPTQAPAQFPTPPTQFPTPPTQFPSAPAQAPAEDPMPTQAQIPTQFRAPQVPPVQTIPQPQPAPVAETVVETVVEAGPEPEAQPQARTAAAVEEVVSVITQGDAEAAWAATAGESSWSEFVRENSKWGRSADLRSDMSVIQRAGDLGLVSPDAQWASPETLQAIKDSFNLIIMRCWPGMRGTGPTDFLSNNEFLAMVEGMRLMIESLGLHVTQDPGSGLVTKIWLADED